MADTPIDKLVYALAGDVSQLQSAFRQAEEGARRTGTTIQQNLGKGFQASVDQATADSNKLNQALGKIGDTAKKTTEHIQVSRREMIYAFRELASGDIQRLPATIALFVSHLLEIEPAALAAGAAVAAIPLALIVSAAKADQALAKLRTSLILTKEASGISLSQAANLASNVAGQGHLSTMGAEKMLGGLIGAGIPSGLLGRMTAAGGNYSLATGASPEDTHALLVRMFNDPSKSAEELNTSMRLLSAEQTEQVKNLTAQGQEEKAAAIILQEFAQRTQDAAQAAGFWTKTWNNLGNIIGNIGHAIGVASAAAGITPGSATASEKIDYYRRQDERMGRDAGQDERIKRLQAQVDAENDRAARFGRGAFADSAVGKGIELGQRGGNASDFKLQELRNNEAKAALALQEAANANLAWATVAQRNADKIGAGGHVPGKLEYSPYANTHFSDETMAAANRTLDAATLARQSYEKYGLPGQREAREAGYRAEMARTPIENEPEVRRRQEALEKKYEELQNPETALSAEKNYRAALSGQAPETSERLKQQQKSIKALNDEAAAAADVRLAYISGARAVELATAESEVDLEITNRTINAKDRQAAILDKVALAYNRAAEAALKQNIAAKEAAEAAETEEAAGGDPRAVRAAKRQAAVEKQFASLRDAQGNLPSDLQRAYEEASSYGQRTDRAQAYGALNSRKFEAGNTLQQTQQMAGAIFGGASDDDIRHLKIYQQAVADVSKELDQSDPRYQAYVNYLTQTNTAMSDLTDAMQKAQAESKELADDITEGLGKMVKEGGKDWWKNSGDMASNFLGTIFKNQVLDPLNKWLTSQFNGLLGPGQLGSSAANPMWVTSVGDNGLPIEGGGGGVPGVDNSGGIFGTHGFGGQGNGGSLLGSLTDPGGVFGDGGFFDTLFGGTPLGVSTTNAALAATDMPAFADIGAADIATALPFLGAAANGGPLSASSYYLVGENGPEILGPGVAGVITPNSAPAVQAALGSRLGYSNDNGGPTIGNMTFNLPNVTDTTSFIRSSSQLSSSVTRAMAKGRRNN